MKAYMGIDIGLKGAIAVIYPNGEIHTIPIPVIS